MNRATTLVALVGADAPAAAAASAGQAANVTHEPLAAQDDFAAAWRRARAHGSIYTLVDADPLEQVVAEWAARLEEHEGELELAIGALPDVGVPDYYLVDVELAHPAIDWYLGLLESLSPRRVVPVRLAGGAVLGALAGLRYGPEFPPPPELAAIAGVYVPAAGRGRRL